MNFIKKFKSYPLKKKKIIFILTIIFVFVIALIAVIFWPDGPPEVSADTIQNGFIQSKIETTGVVSTEDSSKYTLLDGTYVKEVNVAVGSVVKRGDLLATFDTNSIQAMLSLKRDDYTKAKKAYDDYMDSAKSAKASLPELKKQIDEMNAIIAQLEKEIAENEAKTASQTTTQPPTAATTSPSSDSSFFDSLGELIANLVDIKGTIDDLNDMLADFNSLNNTSYDMSSLMAAGMDTPQNQLMSYQLQLVSLNTQLAANNALAEAPLNSVYKSVADKAYDDLTMTENEIKSLNEGWYAKGDGIVTAVNISPDTVYEPVENNSSSIDVDAILSILSSGGNASSLISAFLGGNNENIGIEVKNYDGFIATITLDKYNLQEVEVGQKVIVKSANEQEYDGEVVFVAAEATESSSLDIASLAGSLTGGSGSSSGAVCKIKINNPDGGVVVGFDVGLEIITAVVDDVPVVPVEAVRYDDKGMFIWKLSGGKKTVSKAYVEFGVSEDTKYELVSGAELGDTIIINPPLSLEDGDKVAVKKKD